MVFGCFGVMIVASKTLSFVTHYLTICFLCCCSRAPGFEAGYAKAPKKCLLKKRFITRILSNWKQMQWTWISLENMICLRKNVSKRKSRNHSVCLFLTPHCLCPHPLLEKQKVICISATSSWQFVNNVMKKINWLGVGMHTHTHTHSLTDTCLMSLHRVEKKCSHTPHDCTQEDMIHETEIAYWHHTSKQNGEKKDHSEAERWTVNCELLRGHSKNWSCVTSLCASLQ